MVLSNKLVDLIQRNADPLTRRWMEIVRTHESTPTYHTYDEGELYERAYSVYSQLGRWVSSETTKEEIRDIYTALGERRHKEGFRLSELLQALVITRRVLWSKVLSEGFLDTALDLNQALELSNHVVLFFDRAMVYATQGFESVSS